MSRQGRRDIGERLPGLGADASWHQLPGTVGAELAGEIQHIADQDGLGERQFLAPGQGKNSASVR